MASVKRISSLLCLQVPRCPPHQPALPGKQEKGLIVTSRQAELTPFSVEKSITEKSFVKANCLAALIYIFMKFD